MIDSLKVLCLERMNPIKYRLDLKDFWLLKCSSTLKLLTKSIDNQSMLLLIKLSSCVPSIQGENFMQILLLVVVLRYSKDSRKDYRLECREGSIKDWLSLRKFRKLRYFCYFIVVCPNKCSSLRKSISKIRSMVGRVIVGQQSRIWSNVPYKRLIFRERIINLSLQCCFYALR